MRHHDVALSRCVRHSHAVDVSFPRNVCRAGCQAGRAEVSLDWPGLVNCEPYFPALLLPRAGQAEHRGDEDNGVRHALLLVRTSDVDERGNLRSVLCVGVRLGAESEHPRLLDRVAFRVEKTDRAKALDVLA